MSSQTRSKRAGGLVVAVLFAACSGEGSKQLTGPLAAGGSGVLGGTGGGVAGSLAAAGSVATSGTQAPPIAGSDGSGGGATDAQVLDPQTDAMVAPPPGGDAAVPSVGGCGQTLPAVSDYAQMGPFAPMTINNTGPGGAYTMIRPATPGDNGFLHPIATWGNGITTTPALYPGLLDAIASHGFVIIASNNTNVTAQLMTDGLKWLIEQNAAAGELQGKLDTDCAVTVGYSLGGGAAVGSGSHPAVVATVSFHGLQGPAEDLHAPLFLLTSTADGFVTKSGYVQPCYDRSTKVPTIMATLEVPGAPADFNGHLYPLGDAGEERAPAIAWMRLWVYGDQGARKYFYGGDCILCKTPWIDLQRKNATF